MELHAATVDETYALGRALGAVLEERDFVGLSGQLGAGKTLFSRGVAEGAGVDVSDVSSPTYAIIQSYQGRIVLHHADLYRLTGEADLYSTGYFDLLEGEGAFLVEWVARVPGAVPGDALQVTLEVLPQDARVLRVSSSGPKSELLLTKWLREITARVTAQ